MIRSVLQKVRQYIYPTVVAAGFFLACTLTASALNTDQLSNQEQFTLNSILQTLNPVITQLGKEGQAALLTWEELYNHLKETQTSFIDEMRELRGASLGSTSHYFGNSTKNADLINVGPQTILINGEESLINTQYLPRSVFNAYKRMISAMEEDIEKNLLIESGFRSGAYQLYLFLYYLPTHDYSIRETNRFVALPGHSEHGNPARQAIDFINSNGINGEANPAEFESLPEYEWLLKNAGEFGFILSYPQDNPYNTAFEPWHWHYEENP